jgi:HEAT repeat protein
VRVLAEITDEEVPDLLLAALYDPNDAVRQAAALALRRQPNPSAVPHLTGLLSGPAALLARLAGDALAQIGEESVPILLEVVQNGPLAARLEAVRALALIGDQRSIPTLFEALDDESALVEYWANEGLERMGVGMVFFKP